MQAKWGCHPMEMQAQGLQWVHANASACQAH